MTFFGVDVSVALLAGTDAGLYRFASGAWTLKHSGSYTNAWQFAQFGDMAIGVNGAVPVKYTIARSTAAELGDRKSVVSGKSLSVCEDYGGPCITKNKINPIYKL